MAVVKKILPNSILRGLLKKGDDVVAFNNRPIADILDYIYADSHDSGSITFIRNGEEKNVNFSKALENESLGLEFGDDLEIKPRECRNNCIFCFVRQLPDGLRDTLYVRDDDYRLSFISGSYITCTNLSEDDINRILEYRLSPLYVSVHATDEDVRKLMLGVKKIPPQIELIKRLINGGITIHAQIVLVGGINDGVQLERSLNDLYSAGVTTVAIVPVGLTKHREGKYPLTVLTKDQAERAIDLVEKFYKEHGGFAYCSDEMYQIAGRPVHDAEFYGEYEQIENGVGLISKFLAELDNALETAPKRKIKRKIGIFTGISGESTMIKARDAVTRKYPDVEINIYTVNNDFFGRTVTVSGLVTATDILSQYGDKKFNEDFFMIPCVMLKEFEDVFLDGISVKTLSKKLGKRIIPDRCTGEDFLSVILNKRSS